MVCGGVVRGVWFLGLWLCGAVLCGGVVSRALVYDNMVCGAVVWVRVRFWCTNQRSKDGKMFYNFVPPPLNFFV